MDTALAELEGVVRAARARTRVPGVAAGLSVDGRAAVVADGVLSLGADRPVRPETPFRVASISKMFTAALAVSLLGADERLRRLLSHTADLCPESETPLPELCRGLFSYSNAGFWRAGRLAAEAAGTSFEDAMAERLLRPLRLDATGYEEPAGAARGHVQEGETGHRAVPVDAYAPARRPSGGLWSTVGDLLRFGAHLCGGEGPLSADVRAALRQPQAEALGAAYGLGCWLRRWRGADGIEHEGFIGGYQTLLLVLPEERLVFAALTNSWRGSALIRRVVAELGLASTTTVAGSGNGIPESVAGRYALENGEATVERVGDRLRLRSAETDPVTGVRQEAPAALVEPVGGGVWGAAGGLLLGHRLDFPRPDVARVGWVAMPRVAP